MQPFGTPVVPDVNAMIATSSAAVSTGSNDPRAGRSSSTRTSSGPISPAKAPATIACDTCAFSTTFAISPARSSGIVATTTPPASRIPNHAAIVSAVFGACRSTRVPGSISSEAAIASARVRTSS